MRVIAKGRDKRILEEIMEKFEEQGDLYSAISEVFEPWLDEKEIKEHKIKEVELIGKEKEGAEMWLFDVRLVVEFVGVFDIIDSDFSDTIGYWFSMNFDATLRVRAEIKLTIYASKEDGEWDVEYYDNVELTELQDLAILSIAVGVHPA